MAHRRLMLALSVWVAVFSVGSARSASAACDPSGVQSTGALYQICMPAGEWNGNLVIWAHGYVAPQFPLMIPNDHRALLNGTSLADIVNARGYAFATTSYSTNGLAVKEGVADVLDLVGLVTAQKGNVDKVYIVGLSLGGLIATLALERHPDIFAGGLAACGPIGSFNGQVNYLGDFRVLLDYFYPGLLPGDVTGIPPAFIGTWVQYYAGVVAPTLFAPQNRSKTLQLLRTARLPTVAADFENTARESLEDSLFYAVLATNDANAKLGAQPFENRFRIYLGSSNDLRLNFLVQRERAERPALDELDRHYNTSGRLRRPLIAIHTTLDQQVPAWHETLYATKAFFNGGFRHLTVVPVNRYGHCTFTPAEVLNAFDRLIAKVEGAGAAAAIAQATPVRMDRQMLMELDRIGATFGIAPPR